MTWFLMCPHGLMLRRLAEGWQYAADLGHTHGQWAVLLKWTGEGDPPSAKDDGRPQALHTDP